MSRLHIMIATALATGALASCAGSGVQQPSPPTGAAADEEGRNIVVTGTRIAGAATVRDRAAGAMDASAMPPPAPPPMMVAPAAPVVASRFAQSKVMGDAHFLPAPPEGRDRFTTNPENPFRVAAEEPVSTFSIDVDTASYSFVRASLNRNVLPQKAAVRTEEMINYFPYDYAAPRSAAQPFSSNVAVFPSPWSPGRKLVRIGIKGYALQRATRPRANLVFLIDTSGSMYAENKLPLVRQSLAMLLDQLDSTDRVAIVTYAGSAGTALEPTPVSEKARIRAVIDRLGAGGSTAGAEGI